MKSMDENLLNDQEERQGKQKRRERVEGGFRKGEIVRIRSIERLAM